MTELRDGITSLHGIHVGTTLILICSLPVDHVELASADDGNADDVTSRKVVSFRNSKLAILIN